MSVLTIRKFDRFALRQAVDLSAENGVASEGLLIEISLGGCRISNLGETRFEHGEVVSTDIDGYGTIEGQVRWSRPGVVGLGFTKPLHTPELAELIETCRDRTGELAQVSRYAT